MILVIGTIADEMIELMCSRLNQQQLKYILIDPAQHRKTNFTWSGGNKGNVQMEIIHDGRKVNLKEITGIYTRFATTKGDKSNPDFNVEEKEAMNFEWMANFSNFLNAFPGIVVNRPKHSISNDSKIYQQLQISKYGLHTPGTLVTNDPGEIEKFYASCSGRVIFKSISGIRSIVSELTPDYLKKIEAIRDCPAQFQELIQGLEIRVHVVGGNVYATAIESDAVDYRYASQYGKQAHFYPIDLPAEIEKSCINLARSFGLLVAGIDLKRTSEGKYYCFEVNPSPAFIVYERATRQPISEAVALMLKGSLN